MAETLSLMEFLQALLTDADLRGSFGSDPQGTLADHGLADLSPADVHDALVLVQDNQTVDFTSDPAGSPPPPPVAHDDHEAAVEYLARYLADPQQADQQPRLDDLWADVDADAPVGAAPVPGPDVPFGGPGGAFGAGGADAHGFDTSTWPGADDPPSGYDDLSDLGSYVDLGTDAGADAGADDLGTGDRGVVDAGSPGGDDPRSDLTDGI